MMNIELSVRAKGALQMVTGALAYYLIFSYILRHGVEAPASLGAAHSKIILVGLPGVLALVGVWHFATGRSFSDLENDWMDLSGWKKAAAGGLLTLLAIALVCGVLFLSAYLSLI